MSENPLFKTGNDKDDDQKQPEAYVGEFDAVDKTAADLIREKVEKIYAEEPDASEEAKETEDAPVRSKHQQFMHELTNSGKDLVAIQTEWHNYYNGLPDNEKYEVWQEFYDSQSALLGNQPAPKLVSDRKAAPEKLVPEKATPEVVTAEFIAKHKHEAAKPKRHFAKNVIKDDRKPKEIREAIRNKVTSGGKLKAKHHLQSLMFGLSMGFLVVFIFLFGFFNEVFIAPFIQPSRVSADTPIIISSTGIAPTANPEVIIPKINVEIPVNYNETSTDENMIENDLQDGVVHYPTTVMPGQVGNAAFFGHSSNNIFNQGKYKFAFVLLHTLQNGDTFYLTNNNKVYVYKVISHTIVDPSDVSVLGPVQGQTATATLITCDPPGTSLHRLIVVGQQISPDPSTDSTASAPAASVSSSPTTLPGNGPTLWNKFIGTIYGKIITVAVALAAVIFGFRKIDQRVLDSKR